MDIRPSSDAFVELARQGNLVPVYTELLADFETPVSAYAKLRAWGPSFLLESIEGGERLSRYSFIGCSPRKIIRSGPEKTAIRHADGSVETVPTPADPLKLIEAELAGFKPVRIPGLPPFIGGAVGFLGYEYMQRIEPSVPPAKENPIGTPVQYFLMADTLVVFDRARQTLILLTLAHINDTDPLATYAAAVKRLEALRDALARPIAAAPAAITQSTEVETPAGNFTREEFEGAVVRLKDYIRAGDVIQVVLSQRFERPFHRQPLDLYRALRTVNPSPYMFLLEAEDFATVGASPEVHVKLTGSTVEIRPIAGTRPRGKTVEEDGELEKDLLADEKEKAEHLMLVDLARNDIGRVCEFGSVKVPEFMIIERYSHVMHIVSQVEGRIRPDRTAFDLMRATFPAGTVSGAPKIRAMQLIAEHERDQRGLYAGALAYFSYDGNLDSCIAIRTAVLKNNRMHVQAGAGIVADSSPSAEYEETVNKAKALWRAAKVADGLSSQ
jgi:anthranilate synthase component 1